MRIVKHGAVTQKMYINNPCAIGTFSDVQDYNVNILSSSVIKQIVK
jgi:hypothetical protein